MTLSVKDAGTGIPANELEHLFERFHWVEGARARTQEGSGIGLALVQELVKLHGGAIAVTSSVDVGTTLTVSIPTGAAHIPADRLRATRTQVSTAMGAAPYVQEALRWLPDAPDAKATSLPRDGTGAAKNARILIADDNADMRGYLSRLLAPHWMVSSVADGAEALKVTRQMRPDLVLADVMMPKLDGFALVKKSRADAKPVEIEALEQLINASPRAAH